jgi:hypothetical protein
MLPTTMKAGPRGVPGSRSREHGGHSASSVAQSRVLVILPLILAACALVLQFGSNHPPLETSPLYMSGGSLVE